MTSPHSAGSGRHRGASARPTAQLSRLWRRPNHRSAVKGLGLAASALGVATAFAAPAPGASYELTASEVQRPVVARAEDTPSANETLPERGEKSLPGVAVPPTP